MMLRLARLELRTTYGVEEISLERMNFFHGPTGSGKSSIARLIDFCLGAELERTPAIRSVLVSARLGLRLGGNEVILERKLEDSARVQAYWRTEEGSEQYLDAPITAGERVLIPPDVFSLADLLFRLMGIMPPKVRKNKAEDEAPLIRLGFRDLMWYCYLRQDQIDAQFYHLKDDPRAPKSRDVMRFLLGYWSEKLNEFEAESDRLAKLRNASLESAKQLKEFFSRFGYDSTEMLEKERQAVEHRISSLGIELKGLQAGLRPVSHVTDRMRDEIRGAGTELQQGNEEVDSLRRRVADFEALKKEIISAQFKLGRAGEAATAFEIAHYRHCPACGRNVEPARDGECSLCHQTSDQPASLADTMDRMEKETTTRLIDLEGSILHSQRGLERQERRLQALRRRKHELDNNLVQELASYDSAYLAEARLLEREEATLRERLESIAKAARIPAAIAETEQRAASALAEIDTLKRKVAEERERLSNSNRLISQVEAALLEALHEIKMPGMTRADRVLLDRREWIPYVLPGGDEALAWTFYGIGSTGKKILFNAAYALSVHRVAAENNLPLPELLMIDNPMKGIGDDVNADLFLAFYDYLFKLARGSLVNTQFVLIENDRPPLENAQMTIRERFMSRDDEKHPPLFAKYAGP